MTTFSKKDFTNTKWFIAEKLLQVLVGILIVPKIFNELGTDAIGKLEFSKGIIGMLTPILFLGLSAICIRELVVNPLQKHRIIATTFVLRFFSFLVTIIGLFIYTAITQQSDINKILLLLGTGYLFKITDVFEFYIQATKQSKILFIAKSSSLLLTLLAQYYGVSNHFSVYYFVLLILVDYLIQGLIYSGYLFTSKQLNIHKFQFCKTTAIALLKSGFPLLISNSLILLYITIDELFLKHYINDAANGVFATVEFLVIFLSWNIGAAFIYGLYPALAEVYHSDKKTYINRIRFMLNTVVFFGLSIGVCYTFWGEAIIDTFYDASFSTAKTPLKILCWAPLFVFVGMLYEKHLVNQDKLLNNIYRFSIGCVVNIALCYFLIPPYGLNGAAIAVLTSHFITNIGYIFIRKSNYKKMKLLITKTGV